MLKNSEKFDNSLSNNPKIYLEVPSNDALADKVGKNIKNMHKQTKKLNLDNKNIDKNGSNCIKIHWNMNLDEVYQQELTDFDMKFPGKTYLLRRAFNEYEAAYQLILVKSRLQNVDCFGESKYSLELKTTLLLSSKFKLNLLLQQKMNQQSTSKQNLSKSIRISTKNILTEYGYPTKISADLVETIETLLLPAMKANAAMDLLKDGTCVDEKFQSTAKFLEVLSDFLTLHDFISMK